MKAFRIVAVALVIGVVFGLASCGGGASLLAGKVPADAILFAQIENPDSMLKSIDTVKNSESIKKMIKTIGSQFGGSLDSYLSMSMSELVNTLLQFVFSKDEVVLSKPLALAMRMPNNEDPELWIYIPVKDPQNALSKAESLGKMILGGDSAKMKASVAQDYVVLVIGTDGEKTFPLKDSLNLDNLSRYSDDSIELMFSTKGLSSQIAQLKLGGLSDLFSEFGGSSGSAMGKYMADFLDQLESADLSLRFGSEGLEMEAGAKFVKGKGISDYLKLCGAAPNANDYAKFVRSDSLAGMSLSMNPESYDKMKEFLGLFYDSMLSTVGGAAAGTGLTSEKYKSLLTLAGSNMKAISGQSAMSFDLDLGSSQLTKGKLYLLLGLAYAYGGTDMKPVLQRFLESDMLKISGVTGLKDINAYKAFAKSYFGKDLPDFFKSLGSEMPISFSASVAERKDDILDIQDISLKFDAPLGEAGEKLSVTFPLSVGYSNGLMLVNMESKSAEKMKAIAKAGKVDANLSDLAAYQNFIKTVNGSTQALVYLSSKKLALSILGGEADTQAVAKLFGANSGIFAAVTASEGSVGMRFFVPWADIAGFATIEQAKKPQALPVQDNAVNAKMEALQVGFSSLVMDKADVKKAKVALAQIEAAVNALIAMTDKFTSDNVYTLDQFLKNIELMMGISFPEPESEYGDYYDGSFSGDDGGYYDESGGYYDEEGNYYGPDGESYGGDGAGEDEMYYGD